MADYLNIESFLQPVNIREIAGDDTYNADQVGAKIHLHDEALPDVSAADIVVVGCGEQRGNGILGPETNAPDVIRKHFYGLYFWHEGIAIADLGNIKQGAGLSDTIAALRTVTEELTALNKTVIILGGSHDITLAQYEACKNQKKLIEATVVDAKIDLDMESPFAADNFLMQMFTNDPNYLKHYNHVGFQSYLVHPGMLQTLDKLKFDFYRVGHVKDSIEEVEPGIRSSSLFSFDINAIANAYAPANKLTPNGFTGEEACVLMQYAGMSTSVNTIGIYGYNPQYDVDELTAKQISHMLWYAIDGHHRKRNESALEDRDSFNEFQMIFSEVETVFLQSKKTGRWWMQMPAKRFIPCSYKDYLTAASDEIPNRWFRAQQRDTMPL
ncbi:MAG: arginase [Sphingobacteriales bacterium 41-5]|nr:MAG: arginase [Sphingobacteriales bacterium 41-5]